MTLKLATLCSGMGAPEEAARRAGGIEPIWCAEIEPQPAAVLQARHPGVANLGDITAADFVERALAIGRPDVLVAGTPCQSFSVAGLRKGMADERGNLTLRFIEIADGLDDGTMLTVWENVPGVLSDKGNAFGCLLAGLAGENTPIVPAGGRWTNAGLVVGPKRAAAWRVLDAQYFGLAQRRRRVFVIAGSVDWCRPEEILFEFQGMRRDSAPSRETGQRTAATLTRGADSGGAGGYAGRRREDDVNIVSAVTSKWAKGSGGPSGDECQNLVLHAPDIAGTLKAQGVKSGGENGAEMCDRLIAHTLRGEGFDASEDGCGRGTPIIPINMRQTSRGDKMTNNRQEGSSGGPPGTGIGEAGDPSPAIGCSHTPAVFTDAVRRLMSVECERLQGFPDNYTLIEWKNAPMADGPRYRMIGNSMAVDCIVWLLERIKTNRPAMRA